VIKQLHPSTSDQKICSASVKVATGHTLIRPIQELYPLGFQEDPDTDPIPIPVDPKSQEMSQNDFEIDSIE